jgi:hypothetical protein
MKRGTYLAFVLVEVVRGAEASDGYHEVSDGALEVFPVVDVVEQLDCEGLDLDLVEVWEQRLHDVDNQSDHVLLVVGKLVRSAFGAVDGLLDDALFNHRDQLLGDLALQLEARQMTAVCEDSENLFEDVGVAMSVETTCNLRHAQDPVVEIPDALESNLHDLRHLVLDAEDHSLDQGLEVLLVNIGQIQQSLGAVSDDVMNELEEADSKLWVGQVVVANRGQC